MAWLPAGASVMLLADRFYPSQALFHGLGEHGWQYRLRLKGNLSVDIGRGDLTTTGALAAGVRERYEPEARLFECALPTPIGILHEPGHKEPWMVAMDCPPSRARVLDYGARWGIEPMFSDFKPRGFGLKDTHLQAPERVEHLVLIMALAMYWCVSAGRQDAVHHPTSVEKRHGNSATPTMGRSAKPTAPCSPGSNAACVCS